MVADLMNESITFREDRDLIGAKVGVYSEELGRRYVAVSPALYSLIQGEEKAAVMEGLMVDVNGAMRWILDLQGER